MESGKQNPKPGPDPRATAPAPRLSVRLHPDNAAETESILRSLPAWFGDEAALQRYVETSAQHENFTARWNDRSIGLLSLDRIDPSTAEIHLMAVHADHRGTGVGTRLLDAAQRHLRSAGIGLLRVKTLSSRSPDPHYAHTRRFYTARGFRPIQELPDVWGPQAPCLLMGKTLEPG